MSLSIDQFEDLISNCKYQKASCTGDVPSYAGQRVDESLMEECTTAGNDSDDNEIDERKKSNKFEVVATDVSIELKLIFVGRKKRLFSRYQSRTCRK